MSRSALDITEEAVRLWRSLHGNESLDQQCQRFDGHYWQWVWAGTETGIVPYETATAAANASEMYSTNVNDPNVLPGHLANWWWNPEGHVGTVMGVSNGRVLVSHTSSKGDIVLALGNNVKISHADTINLRFRGYSSTNGRNQERVGVSPWPQQDTNKTAQAEEEEDMNTYFEATANSTPGKDGTSRIWAGNGRKVKSVGDDGQVSEATYSGVWERDSSGSLRRLFVSEWPAIQEAFAASGRKVPLAKVHGNLIEQMYLVPRTTPGV